MEFGKLGKEEKIENLDNSKLRIGQDDDEFCNKILVRLNKKEENFKKIQGKQKWNSDREDRWKIFAYHA